MFCKAGENLSYFYIKKAGCSGTGGRFYCVDKGNMIKLLRVIEMPRQARRKSESRIYHVMIRGINRQTIFEEDADKLKFLQTLKT